MYSWSPNLSQISLKTSFEKVFFQISAPPKSKWCQMKIGYLAMAAILKRYKNFIYFFSWNVVVISVFTYGEKMILKIRWELLSGVPWNSSLCTNGTMYLMQLSVRRLKNAYKRRPRHIFTKLHEFRGPKNSKSSASDTPPPRARLHAPPGLELTNSPPPPPRQLVIAAPLPGM